MSLENKQIGFVVKEVGKPPQSYMGIESMARAMKLEDIEMLRMILDPTNVLGQETIAPIDVVAAKSNEVQGGE